MTTWLGLQERVRSRYDLDLDTENEFAVTVRPTKGRADGPPRAQRVLVRRYVAWGREMFEIRSAFGSRGRFDPETLLEDALRLPIGAIATHGGYHVIVQKGCLGDHTIDGVLFLITHVGMLADALEEGSGEDFF